MLMSLPLGDEGLAVTSVQWGVRVCIYKKNGVGHEQSGGGGGVLLPLTWP